MAAGKFITFEGGEGAGKSTQVARLADALRGRGITVLTTREPGGAPRAERIRELLIDADGGAWDPLSEALLHFAARREHFVGTIRPALAAGNWVISDRFADSTLAYQGYGLGLDQEVIARLYRITLGDFRPDATLVLDLPVAAGMARACARGETDRYERMDSAFHGRLRDGFKEICLREPDRCILIDAAPDSDHVAKSVWAAVETRLMA